jgi:hypothetical protein
VQNGKTTALCAICDRHTPIDDLIEAIPVLDQRVIALDVEAEEEHQRAARMLEFLERQEHDKFHAFLAHNSKDKSEVESLVGKLRDQGILAWFDRDQILPGQQFIPALEEILDIVPVACIIVGPNSLGPWERQEYYTLLTRFVDYRRQKAKRQLSLIPVLLPGANIENCLLPAFLRGFSWVDFNKPDGLENRAEMRRLVRAILGERPEGNADGSATG